VSQPDDREEPSAERPKKRHLSFWQELALLLGVALVLAVGIKALFLQAFYIPSGSMNDTLVFNDRILVQKVSYWGSAAPERGDVVKRVIGVGGDTVACCDRRGRVTVNGTALEERSYLAAGERPSERTFEQEVPEGYLWVMGDNRSQSADSRFHLGDPGGGFVPEENVVGKVFSVVWPLGHAKMLSRPETFEAVEAP
jgi:signal peptidase I